MDNPALDDIARRPQQYWNVDGLPEVTMGLLWMVWGGAWIFGETLPHDWRWNAFWMFTPVFLVFTGLAAGWITKRLKARVTFPRTGYVEWKEPTRAAHLAGAALAMVAAAVIVTVMRGEGDPARYAAPVVGVILSLAFLAVSVRQRAPHFLAFSALALGLGLAFGARGGGWASVNWLFVALGAATAIVGAVRLARFIRKHPRPAVEGA